jgi:murein DD-endopeptidase MepM/ murein hydrolase activator NlpD
MAAIGLRVPRAGGTPVRKAAKIGIGGLLLAMTVAGRDTGVASGAPAFGTYAWPVEGQIIRFFEAPATPFSAGHRGIDIAVPFGTPIHAPAAGTVTFAGWIAGSMFMTLDHGDGVKTSYSWLSGFAVARGDAVRTGEKIAYTGHGHPDVATPHLHFSARVNGMYVDPLLLLAGLDLVSLIRLAPLAAIAPAAA